MRPRLLGLLQQSMVVLVLLLAATGLAAADPSSSMREDEVRIVLEPVARVTGGTVTLADIALLEGPHELTERLKEVPVGPAPLPGRSRWVETAYLAVRLRQAGIDPATVRVEGPERVELVTTLAAGVLPEAEPGMAGTPAAGVARGDTVVLEAVAGRVVIQVSARALRAGRAGDRIPVLNLSSGREVEAVVVGPGRVRVEVAP